jgi:hypothetical protein
MNIAVVASIGMIITTFMIHFFTLWGLSAGLPTCRIRKEFVVLLAVAGIFLAHLFEIALYAVTYSWLSAGVKVGGLEGATSNDFMDFFYYSTVMYTSLGIGDIYPSEHLRIISGLETLNGLVLIGWSTSFTFIVMRRFWFRSN